MIFWKKKNDFGKTVTQLRFFSFQNTITFFFIRDFSWEILVTAGKSLIRHTRRYVTTDISLDTARMIKYCIQRCYFSHKISPKTAHTPSPTNFAYLRRGRHTSDHQGRFKIHSVTQILRLLLDLHRQFSAKHTDRFGMTTRQKMQNERKSTKKYQSHAHCSLRNTLLRIQTLRKGKS